MKHLIRLALCLLATSLGAEEFRQTIAVTSTSQTITLGGQRTSISLYNCNSGTTATCAGDSAYFRLFDCNQTPAAATTSSTPLAKGEYVSFSWSKDSEAAPYCSFSIVTTGAETATIRVIAK